MVRLWGPGPNPQHHPGLPLLAETYRQRFRSKTIMEGETAKELQARLKDLMGKWLVPELLTKAEVCDRIVLEQFLGMLHPELQVWVRERTPASSAQAADLAITWAHNSRTGEDPTKQPSESLTRHSLVSLWMVVVVCLSSPMAPIAPVLAQLQLEHLGY
uniref:SCAN box domain-containing protein n=1 Tax=Sander lucioperca TaxID=283035 RepID=A0A8D0D0N8_SANLU